MNDSENAQTDTHNSCATIKRNEALAQSQTWTDHRICNRTGTQAEKHWLQPHLCQSLEQPHTWRQAAEERQVSALGRGERSDGCVQFLLGMMEFWKCTLTMTTQSCACIMLLNHSLKKRWNNRLYVTCNLLQQNTKTRQNENVNRRTKQGHF